MPSPLEDTHPSCEASLASFTEAVNSEDFAAAAALAVRVSELAPAFAAAGATRVERDERWRRVLESLESARRSALAARQHLRLQVGALRQSSAYSRDTLEREPRWTTAL